MFILLLSSGFVSAVDDTDSLPAAEQQQVVSTVDDSGVPIISADQARTMVLDAGGSEASAQAVSDAYADSQVAAIQQALFIVFVLLVLALLSSRHLPNRIVAQSAGEDEKDDQKDATT